MIGNVSGNGIAVGLDRASAPTRLNVCSRTPTSRRWWRPRTSGSSRGPGSASGGSPLPSRRPATWLYPRRAQALEQAGVAPEELDLVVVATATPDMLFPATAAIVADALGAKNAAAYDLLAGCTGFVYALSQAYGPVATGLSKRALVIGAEVLSKITNWQDRSTCILFGDGAGAAVVQPIEAGGIVGFELGADGSGGPDLCVPAGGSRRPISAETLEEELQFIKMNGAEVFRFATRVMVSSAEELLAACGATDRRRRPVRPAPGEQAHRRPRGEEPGPRPGQGADEHRPVRKHVVRLHPDLPRGSPGRRAAGGGDARAHERGRRRPHVGLGLSDLDVERRKSRRGAMKIAFCFPGQGSQDVGMGRAIAAEFPGCARGVRRGVRSGRLRRRQALLRGVAGGADADRAAAACARGHLDRLPSRGEDARHPARLRHRPLGRRVLRACSRGRDRRRRRGRARPRARRGDGRGGARDPGRDGGVLGLDDAVVEELCQSHRGRVAGELQLSRARSSCRARTRPSTG